MRLHIYFIYILFLAVGIVFPFSISAKSIECNQILAPLGAPENKSCWISEADSEVYRQCLIDFRDVIKDTQWFRHCGFGQLTFYKQDRESFLRLVQARTTYNEQTHTTMIFNLDFLTIESSAFSENPKLYTDCTLAKIEITKNKSSSIKCNINEMTAFSQNREGFLSCLQLPDLGYIWSPFCSSIEFLDEMRKNPNLAPACIKIQHQIHSFSVKDCISLGSSINLKFPLTVALCVRKFGMQEIERCTSYFETNLSKNSYYISTVETCLKEYSDIEDDFWTVCADFGTFLRRLEKSADYSFFSSNVADVKACLKEASTYDRLIDDYMCRNPKVVKLLASQRIEYLACLESAKRLKLDFDYCEEDRVRHLLKLGYGENFGQCLDQFEVRKRRMNQVYIEKIPYDTLDICAFPVSLKCAGTGSEFRSEYYRYLTANKMGQGILGLQYEDFYSLDWEKIQCPQPDEERAMFECINKGLNSRHVNPNRRSKADDLSKLTLQCAQCFMGVDDFVASEEENYYRNDGIQRCHFLADQSYFLNLGPRQMCFALANKKGFRDNQMLLYSAVIAIDSIFDFIHIEYLDDYYDPIGCAPYLGTLPNTQEYEILPTELTPLGPPASVQER